MYSFKNKTKNFYNECIRKCIDFKVSIILKISQIFGLEGIKD